MANAKTDQVEAVEPVVEANPLDELFDAWDKETGDGRDHARAVEISDAYVADNASDFAGLRELTIEECVALVDVQREAAAKFREAGMENLAVLCDSEKLRIDVWLLHAFEPQNIGGVYKATLRNVGI